METTKFVRARGTNYNQFHNILRLFDVLPNFPFTASETTGDYYLQTWYIQYIQVASRVAERRNNRLSTLHRIFTAWGAFHMSTFFAQMDFFRR